MEDDFMVIPRACTNSTAASMSGLQQGCGHASSNISGLERGHLLGCTYVFVLVCFNSTASCQF
jgi:hypothetical protein